MCFILFELNFFLKDLVLVNYNNLDTKSKILPLMLQGLSLCLTREVRMPSAWIMFPIIIAIISFDLEPASQPES